MVPVTMWGKNVGVETIGMIDSGEDISAMLQSFAELLGSDLSGEEDQSCGIGGEVRSVLSRATLEIKKGHER